MKTPEHAVAQTLPRGVPRRFLDQQRPPNATWMAVDAIAANPALHYNPRMPGRKVLLGAVEDSLIGLDDPRHILTVAGSRSGKSVGLISNGLFYRGSLLATDPKGELAERTAARRFAMGQQIHVLDPFGIVGGDAKRWRASYNPLDVLQPGSPTLLEDAASIADSIVVTTADQRDPHWDESAKNFIEGVIVHVAMARRYGRVRNLLTVRDLLKKALWVAETHNDTDDKSERKAMPALFVELLANAEALEADAATAAIGGLISAAAYDFYSKATTERAGVFSTINRHTRFLDYPAFRAILAESTLNLRDLKANPKGVSVYLCFPGTRAELARRWMRIFVNQMLDAMEREKTKPAAPVLVCLDEFHVLGYMKQLEMAAALIASFDVKLWVVLQDWSQGIALYDKRWETFAGNAGVMQFFGNSDLTTTEYISKRLGKTLVEVTRVNEVASDQQSKGLSGRTKVAELYDLLTPSEIALLFARDDPLQRQILLWAGHEPMAVQRVLYYDARGPLARFQR